MPLTSPTNCWTNAEDRFATAVANSAAFQTLVGAANATAAAAQVFFDELDDPLDGESFKGRELQDIGSYAQVYCPEYRKQRGGSSRLDPYGACVLYVSRMITDMQSESELTAELWRTGKNSFGDIADQVVSYLEAQGGPYVMAWEVSDGPGFNSRDKWATQGAWQGVEITFTWGLPG